MLKRSWHSKRRATLSKNDPSFSEVLHSKQLTFLIGPEETPVVLDAGAIARLSKPLNCLVNGRRLPAHLRVLLPWDLQNPKPERFSNEEVDTCKDAFRLADPILTIHKDDVEDDIEEPAEPLEPSEPSLDPSVFEYAWSPKHAFWTFNIHSGARFKYPGVSQESKSWRENFAPVLLAYARLYAFAEQYLTLSVYILFASGLEAIVQLARFAYDSYYIPDREGKTVVPLRQLAVAYVVAQHKYFLDFPAHRKLLEGRNEYATDFINHITRWADPDCIYWASWGV
ncbi:hypothetical protein PSPO01_15023 [Paraphaeosphaeria sporulosa]